MKKLIDWIKEKIGDYRHKKMIKRKLAELKKKDPFIYNH
jgi:hypothetical protein